MFDFIVRLIADAGYLGIAVLMFAEHLFLPIPLELIMPFAGFVAARGELSLPGAILAGSLGSLAGMHAWYEVGRAIVAKRLERGADGSACHPSRCTRLAHGSTAAVRLRYWSAVSCPPYAR